MLLFFFACATAPMLEPSVAYYSADSVIETTSGFGFDESYIVRRFLDPTTATLREEFIATADGTAVEVYFDVDVASGTFALTFSDDSYVGTGNLHGDAWDWTSWDSHSVAADGSWVDSDDARDSSGAIHAEKAGFSPDGDEEWTLVEDLSPIDESEWQSAFDGLPAR